MTREAMLPVGDEGLHFFRREGMAPEAGYVLHADAMNLPILVAAKACILFRYEGVNLFAVSVFAGKLFHEHMPGMSRGFIHGQRSLRGVVPMALRTGLPRRFISMRFRRLAVGCEDKLHEQPVLFYPVELVAVLTDHV